MNNRATTRHRTYIVEGRLKGPIMKSRIKTTNEDKSFASLRSLIWHYKWRFLTTDAMRIISSASMALLPLFLARLVTSVDDKDQAFKYLLLILLINLIHWIFWHGGDYYNLYKINPLFYEYKKITFTMFWNKKYTTFIEKPSGKVSYYINQFRSELYGIYDAYHYGFLPIATSIPIYLYLIYRAAWQNSLVYGIFVIFNAGVLILLTKPLNKNQRIATDADSSNSGRVFDSYANFVNVFAFRVHKKEVVRNDHDVDGVIKKDIAAGKSLLNYWITASFLVRLMLWPIILLYSWHLYDAGTITFADLIISATILFDFTHQYWNVVHELGIWNQNTSRFRESYNYLFPGQNAVKDFYQQNQNLHDMQIVTLEKSLNIRDLTFAYPDASDHPVLKNINIEVAKNEKIGIVGKSGSGKSTLIKILLGFYPLTQGEILVDGVNVDTENLSQLYAYVPQDTTLFQESIFYNIAYARDGDISFEEVKAAAEKAHISEFIDELPDGYDTLVGERGIKLSLGQRQRIAIARAFLKKSELLILDEATSSLDSRTESYVQESFEKLWGGKSVIAIAHRLSTLNNVDRIIVMSKGEIVEQGTKDELLALDGYFADLWHHQRKGMI